MNIGKSFVDLVNTSMHLHFLLPLITGLCFLELIGRSRLAACIA